MIHHLQTGFFGEEVAAEYLLSSGYRILQRNFRSGRDEIDIIARDEDERNPMIVFVEVKTRMRASEAYPTEKAVDGRKRRAMKRAIARWVREHDYDGPGRTDVICVTNERVTKHLKDLGSDFY